MTRRSNRELTTAQQRAYDSFEEFVLARKRCPSTRELGRILGITNVAAWHILKALERKGILRHQEGSQYELLGSNRCPYCGRLRGNDPATNP